MSTLISDLRYSVRSLLKNPGLTVAAILSLGLGIGANTTIFTWVQAVLFRPIPVAADPGSIRIAAMENREGQSRSWSYPNYQDFRDRATLVDVVAQDDQTYSIAVDDTAERTWGGLVSGNFFQVMGLHPAAGRLFTPQDDVTPGGHPVVVISHAYWQRRFNGDPGIVDRQVTINNTPMTVVGVAPVGFIGSFLGVAASAWVPMAMQREMMGGDRMQQRGNGWMQSLVRLKPGVSEEQAQAEAASIMAQLEREHPQFNEGRRLRIVQTWEAPFGAGTVLTPLLAVLSILVALVLVIACANVANLLLSKAVSRRREVAVRLSLGASRLRLVRQLLTESLMLAMIAGLGGVVMAYWTMDVIMAFAPPVDMPLDLGLRMDGTTLLFAVGVSVITGVLFGLAPALQASSSQTINALKEEGRSGSGGRTTGRLRNALVVSQVAVCLVLLVGATLFLRSFIAAQALSPGFDADRVVTASMDMFPSGYTGERYRDFQRRTLAAVQALPGVQSAAFGSRLPLGFGGNNSTTVAIDGYTPRQNEEITINYSTVGARYFETMSIPIRAGREYNDTDTATSPRTIVINEAMARRYWPDGNARRQDCSLRTERQRSDRDRRRFEIQQHQRAAVAAVVHPDGAQRDQHVAAVRAHRWRSVAAGGRSAQRHSRARCHPAGLRRAHAERAHADCSLRATDGSESARRDGCARVVAGRDRAVWRDGLRREPTDAGARHPSRPRRLTVVFAQHDRGAGHETDDCRTGDRAVARLGCVWIDWCGAELLPGISPLDPITFIAVPAVLAMIALLATWIPARRAGKVDPLVALRVD